MLIPVILSGGAGTRLWPISRETHPKPFIKLPDGQSLLQKAFYRASQFDAVKEIFAITNQEYYLKIKPEFNEIKFSHNKPNLSFILEPNARNTAPAIAMAALKACYNHGEDCILLVLPADHLITNNEAFINSCKTAFQLAEKNHIVTFGIKPTSPETGYGYIECDNALDIENTYKVMQFVEKPSYDLAEIYMRSGRFLWNSGMFCFKAGAIIKQFALHAPNLFASAAKCWNISNSDANPSVINLDKVSFNAIDSISIDYAIMEKSRDICVVACDFDWQDIGSWSAFKNIHESDKDGNSILGQAIVIDSQDNFIRGENRMIASIGIKDLVIIDTQDALLITHRERSQDVSKIVQLLKTNAHESYHTHKTVIRPWGSFSILEETKTFKIKRLIVKPKACLSLQSHKHRSEHWVVVKGIATIINGEKQFDLHQNESTFIPKENIHRIANNQDTDLVIIEVQTGDYLGEDDIVRYEDNYGRTIV